MRIAALIFPGMDQMDFTGPFEVLSRLPDAQFHMVWKEPQPVRDMCGLLLTPDATLESELDPLDVLLVPGGAGQVELMEDRAVLEWLQARAAQARYVLSVCTGALTLGAAGLLQGRRATTHWNSASLLPHFGATLAESRVVIDGDLISTSGVTAGIDGALHLAALLAGEEVAQQIQLEMQYAPEPPFSAGTPDQAPKAVRERSLARFAPLTERRRALALRVASRLLNA